MLNFEGIVRAENPSNRILQRGWGTRGHPWETPSSGETKHSPGAPALFPRLRLVLHHPIHVFVALSRAIASCVRPSAARQPLLGCLLQVLAASGGRR
jgi:hypothetical protein